MIVVNNEYDMLQYRIIQLITMILLLISAIHYILTYRHALGCDTHIHSVCPLQPIDTIVFTVPLFSHHVSQDIMILVNDEYVLLQYGVIRLITMILLLICATLYILTYLMPWDVIYTFTELVHYNLLTP